MSNLECSVMGKRANVKYRCTQKNGKKFYLSIFFCEIIFNILKVVLHIMGRSAKATRKGSKVRSVKKTSTPNGSKSGNHPTRNKQSRNLSQKLKKAGLKK
ncbi:hypothetical protein XU18_1972 [Perkinsela sp. CCAP 1560/4]|nr:hypothetical protein XU18_1972 [Perkinsela sp. CCAP 1560/4]|eukprot:KNH07440.1 hypothetical protein XU18_1972 [Perkinsela sp. CCAP 1560/4]